MGPCPSCESVPLEPYEAGPGIEVEICSGCRGIFVDRDEISRLLGPGSIDQVAPAPPDGEKRLPCPKCGDQEMGGLLLEGAGPAEAWECPRCAGLWLTAGGFSELARRLGAPVPRTTVSRRRRRGGAESGPLAYGRSRHDAGRENLVGVPAALLLAWVVCSIPVGRLFAALVGMVFHELGHAAASWVSSRIAVPLPFVTFWSSEQSFVMGLVVFAVLAWLLVHTWRERNRFMFAVAALVGLLWAVTTFVVAAERTLMWQILAGGLGELIFPAFLLIGFHFPLPDRLRWDFWRWVVLAPAALSFVRAVTLWRAAANDPGRMPWGSALGRAGDGDLNRLVAHFEWSGPELADFYVAVGSFCLATVFLAWVYGAYRVLLVGRRS